MNETKCFGCGKVGWLEVCVSFELSKNEYHRDMDTGRVTIKHRSPKLVSKGFCTRECQDKWVKMNSGNSDDFVRPRVVKVFLS